MPGPDVFRTRKCIHVRLRREVHAGFRVKCFERAMSMQEVIDEFARLVAVDDKRVIKLLDEYAARKVQDEIRRLATSGSKRPPDTISELDQGALYDLISKGKT